MIFCPNKNSKEFKKLVSSVGENRAYFLWNKYEGEVPSSFYNKVEKQKKIEFLLDTTLYTDSLNQIPLSKLPLSDLQKRALDLPFNNSNNKDQILKSLFGISSNFKATTKDLGNIFYAGNGSPDYINIGRIANIVPGSNELLRHEIMHSLTLQSTYFEDFHIILDSKDPENRIKDFYDSKEGVINKNLYYKAYKAYANLNKIFTKYEKTFIKQITGFQNPLLYGLTNLDEFIAESTGNNEFRIYLKLITLNNNTLLQEIDDSVNTLIEYNYNYIVNNSEKYKEIRNTIENLYEKYIFEAGDYNKDAFLNYVKNYYDTSQNHITYSQALEKARQMLPDFNEKDLRFVVQSTLGGKNILGEYKAGVISVLSDSQTTTQEYILRHELFHKVFTEYLTSKEQRSLQKAFALEFGDPSSLLEFEEQLALKFQDWKNNKQVVKSNIIQIIFNKILRFFGLISVNTKSLDAFFNQVEQGTFSVKKQDVTSTVKNLDTITRIYGSPKNFKELKSELDNEIKRIQEKGYVIQRKFLYLDGLNVLNGTDTNVLADALGLSTEIGFKTKSVGGRYIDQDYLIQTALRKNPKLREAEVHDTIETYYHSIQNMIIDKLEKKDFKDAKQEERLRQILSRASNRYKQTSENIFLNNHVNRDEITSIIKQHFYNIWVNHKNNLNAHLAEMKKIEDELTTDPTNTDLTVQLSELQIIRKELGKLKRKYEFISDNRDTGLKFLYESSYPSYSSKRNKFEFTISELTDLEEEQERTDEVDSDYKPKEFAFDAETKNQKRSLADSAKIILSTVIDPDKIDKVTGEHGVKLSYSHAYVLAVKLLEGLDPSVDSIPFDKQIDLKLDSLDADSSTVAVGKVIKKLYSKATTELLIKNNTESIALPKHAKFLDTNTFIISLKGEDVQKIKNTFDVVKYNQEKDADIHIIRRQQTSKKVIENTASFSYRVLKEIENLQYFANVKEDSENFIDNSSMSVINLLHQKMINSLTFIELAQNILSQKEKNRYIGLGKIEKNGSFKMTYRAAMQRTTTADAAKKIESSIFQKIQEGKNVIELRNSTFSYMNKNYTIGGVSESSNVVLKFEAIKHFLKYLGYSDRVINSISLNSFDTSKSKLKVNKLYLDLHKFIYDKSTKNRLDSFVNFDAKRGDVKVEKKRDYTEEEIANIIKQESKKENFDEFTLQEKLNEGFTYFVDSDLSLIIEDNKSLLKQLSSFVLTNVNSELQTMSISADGKKKYSHIPSSVAVDTLKRLEAGIVNMIPLEEQTQYDYLKAPHFKYNIFNPLQPNRLNTIEKQIEDDGFKIEFEYGSNEITSVYTKELLKEFYTRTFNNAFLNVALESSTKKLQYIQFLPIISNRPVASGAKINMLNSVDLKKGLEQIVLQYINRPTLTTPGFDNLDKYDPKSFTNLLLLEEVMKDLKLKDKDLKDNVERIANKMYDKLLEKSKNISKTLIQNDVYLNSDLSEIYEKLQPYLDLKAYPWLKDSLFSSNQKFRESLKNVKDRVKEDVKNKKLVLGENENVDFFNEDRLSELGYFKKQLFDENLLLPFVSLFVANDYVNSYFLDQIVMGDSSIFPNPEAKVKRRQAVFAPGLRLIVNSKIGIEPKFKVAVAKDPVVRKEDSNTENPSIRNFLTSLGIEGKLLDELLKQYDDKFEPTDGQGFMLPERYEDIKHGIGMSYGLGTVLKPAHYEVDKYGIGRAMKYSSIVLTDELAEEFPSLKILRQKMRNKNIGEFVFHSAVKVGAPLVKNMVDSNLIFTEGYEIPDLSILELDNNNYKLQLNPEHDVESQVAKPTQLSYFLSIVEDNVIHADQVYKAYAKITDIKLNAFKKELGFEEDGKIDNEKFINILEKSLEKGSDQRVLQLLSEASHYKPNADASLRRSVFNKRSLAWNHPAITDKMFTQTMSLFNNRAVHADFQGSKLVLQSSWGTINKRGQERELKYFKKDGKLYMEAVVPRGLLSSELEKQIEDAIKNGEELPELFLNGDLFGFRIPSSEIHSGVSIKVVDFYDSPEDMHGNIIIAPKELVPLHGSDFDVDSLYIIKRIAYSNYPNVKNEKGEPIDFRDLGFTPGEYIGYEKVNGKMQLQYSTSEGIVDTKHYETLIQEHKNKYLSLYGPGELYDRIEKYLNDVLIKYYQNIITESFLTVLQDEKNNKRMLSPIEMNTIKGIIDNILENHPKLNIKSGLDESFIGDKQKIHASSMNGRDGTGISANDVKSFAYMIRAAANSKKPVLKNDLDAFYFTNPEGYSKMSDSIPMWFMKDSVLNASIDNVKAQILPQLNITSDTMPIFMTMLGMGMDVETAVKIMMQPALKYISSLTGKVNSADDVQSLKSMNKLKGLLKNAILNIDPTQKALLDNINKAAEDISFKEHLLISEEELEKGLSYVDNKRTALEDIQNMKDLSSLIVQYKILANAAKTYSITRYITNMSRSISIIRDLPVFYDDHLSKIDQIKSIFKQEDDGSYSTADKFPFEIDNFFEVNPHIKATLDVLFTADKLAKENFFKYSDTLKDIDKKHLLQSLKLDVNENLNYIKIREEYLKALITSTLPIENTPDYKSISEYGNTGTLKRHVAFNQHFINKLLILFKLEPTNEFLSKISVVKNAFQKNIYTLNYNNSFKLEIEDVLDILDNFYQLNKYEIVNITQEEYNKNSSDPSYHALYTNYYKVITLENPGKTYSELQKDFVEFALFNYGLGIGKNNYSAYLPFDIQKEDYFKYENLLRSLTPSGVKETLDNFEIDAILNHGLNLPDLKDKVLTNYSGYENNIYFDLILDGSKVNPKKYIKWGTTIYILVANRKEDLNRIYYQKVGQVNKTNYYTVSRNEDTNNFDSYKISEKFNPSIYTLRLLSLPKDGQDMLISDSILSKMAIGDVIRISDLKDPQRKYSKYYKINSKSTQGVYTFKQLTDEELLNINSLLRFPVNEAIIVEDMSTFSIDKAKYFKKSITDVKEIPFKNLERNSLEETHAFFYDKANDVQKSLLSLINTSHLKEFGVVFNNKYLRDEKGELKKNKLGKIEMQSKTIELRAGSDLIKSSRSYDLTWTYLHELVHASTFNVLNADENLLTEKQLKGKRRLEQLKDKVKRLSKQDKVFLENEIFDSLDEFVAESFSNYKLQKYLSSKKIEKESLWTKFSKRINEILGISDDSILTEIMSIVLEITEDSIPSITLEAPLVLYKTASTTNVSLVRDDLFLDKIQEQSNQWSITDDEKYYLNTQTGNKKYIRTGERIHQIAFGKNSSENSIEKRAESMFVDSKVDENKERYVSGFARKMTKEEYIEESTKKLDTAIIKGKLIDLSMQFVLGDPSKRDSLKNEIIELEKNADMKTILLKNAIISNIEMIVQYKLKSNLLDKRINEALKDKVVFQQKTGSKYISTAGTLDMLIQHSDNTFSLTELKTSAFDYDEDKLINLMLEGDTPLKNVDNTVRSRAKLQNVLYAMFLKLNNPSMKFRNLNVLHLPNTYSIDNTSDHLDSIEVYQYLTMIKKFFNKDIELQKKLNLIPQDSEKNAYELLIQEFIENGANPKFAEDLFEVTDYSIGYELSKTVPKNPLYDRSIDSTQTEAEMLLDELSIILTPVTDNREFIKARLSEDDDSSSFKALQKKRIKEITERLLILKKRPIYDYRTAEDISITTLTIGTSSDVTNPIFLVWNKVKMEREAAFRKNILEKNNRFDILYDKVFKDVFESTAYKVGIGQKNTRELFQKYVKEEEVRGRMEERLLLETDTEEWSKLSTDEKKLLTFMNNSFKEYFKENSYLNQVAGYKIVGNTQREVTHIDIYNERKTEADKFYYYEGWFPKVFITKEEVNQKIIERYGTLQGISTLIKAHVRMELTNFYEKQMMDTEETSAIPIRNLGNNRVIMSKNYSLDLENMFKTFVENTEHKIQNDDVHSFGRALTIYLNDDYSNILGSHYRYNQENAKSQLVFKNLIAFINDRMRSELRGTQYKHLNFTVKGKPIGLPGTNKQLDFNKTVLYGTRWATGLVMHLRPINAFGNTMHGQILLTRDALKNDIGYKFAGIDKRGIDFTSKTLLQAEKDYFEMAIADSVSGKLASNKLLLLSSEFGYLPDEYGFIKNRKGLKAEKNKLFNSRNLYFMHNVGENYLAYLTLSAQLRQMTMQVDGKEVSVWDLYKVKEYDENFALVEPGKGGTNKFKVVWTGPKRYVKEGAEIIELEGLSDREVKKLKRVYSKMQGDYRKDELTKLDMYVHTKAMIVLKKFFTRIILNAFQGLRTEEDLGYYKQINEFYEVLNEKGELTKEELLMWHARITEGKWITLGNSIATIIKAGATMNYSTMEDYFANLSDDQKLNLIDAMLTMGTFVLFSFLGHLIFADTDEDDTLKKMWTTYLIENPSQQYNIVDMLRTGKTVLTPIVVVKAFDATYNLSILTVASGQYLLGNEEDAINQRGDLKGAKQFAKTIPYAAWAFDLHDKVKNIDQKTWMNEYKFRN